MIKHIFIRFRSFFSREYEKLKFKQVFAVAFFSLYYDEQFIVDGFWMMVPVNRPPNIQPKWHKATVETEIF